MSMEVLEAFQLEVVLTSFFLWTNKEAKEQLSSLIIFLSSLNIEYLTLERVFQANDFCSVRAIISSCTSGVAVAVRAIVGGSSSSFLNSLSRV